MRRASGLVLVAAGLALLGSEPSLAQDAEKRRGFSIEITEPKNQDFVLGKSRIAAVVNATRPELVDRVEFFVGDELIFVDREPPYETFYDFGEKSKPWVVRAVAYHKEEISVSDVAVTRKLDIGYVEEVNRVLLWATALDREGNLVTDLEKKDFRVREAGVEQAILEFYPENRPITLAILLDSSTSMRDPMREVHIAAGSFVDTLRPDDRALVMEFSDKVFLLQDLTADQEALKEAISGTEALGGTALYDALHAAYRKLRGIQGRKAIILLSDGDDTTSQFAYERVLEETKTSGVLFYGIGLGSGVFGGGMRKGILKDLSEVTGGRAYFVGKASELEGVYQKIALELRHQYYLTYSTSNAKWDGRWIKIEVDTPKRELEVRARQGFFAVREGSKP